MNRALRDSMITDNAMGQMLVILAACGIYREGVCPYEGHTVSVSNNGELDLVRSGWYSAAKLEK